ncbi:glycoside hydrolase family 78 protein [Arthrobacter sp. NicSoilB8]|uniref:glycoside hydrolase family 78 protein n=1 Tax=Arthrobacter sp. NicSoilB8 TaxID=2830998 RepID=UPI001CC60D28|nr:glycoside hydrolase family 78 protein [Arthrobacter sp. NicSoilB8]BCW71058.1 alpha-L-rhamnosidase [Arthrobacter sp. NicSoilB8]
MTPNTLRSPSQDTALPMATIPSAVRFEHHEEPFGIGEGRPRLSWQVATGIRDWVQTAYELQLGPDEASLTSYGRTETREQLLQPWPAPPLESRQRAAVRVRVWGNGDDMPSEWSPVAYVEAGLLTASDWQAAMIRPAWVEASAANEPAARLSRTFEVAGPVASARLYASAHGVYVAHINGRRVGRDILAPGWTSYHHRLRYQSYDVTEYLRQGTNVIGLEFADGWWRGNLGFQEKRNTYGSRTAVIAQLEMTDAGGAVSVIGSDASWLAGRGPVLSADLYDGETFDARLRNRGWAETGTETGAGTDTLQPAVVVGGFDPAVLAAPDGPPVRATDELPVRTVLGTPSGKTILDFGQNLVGRVRFKVNGAAGTEVVLRHAEVLEHGELGVRPLRVAKQTDRYFLRGGGEERWEPEFTIHGFRYVEVSGWPGELDPEAFTAVVIHSELVRTGAFECSDPMLNQLHSNVVWGMRGNFVDVPTDCPQRNERLGWTGDFQIFAATASFLYRIPGFTTSWLKDLAAEQGTDGPPPLVVPEVVAEKPPFPDRPVMAAWGDAAVLVPWVLYQRTGDLEFLRRQLPGMMAWLEAAAQAAGPELRFEQGFQFGDWLDPAAPPDSPGDARTPWQLVAQAYLAYSASVAGAAAGLLGRDTESERLRRLSARSRLVFRERYLDDDGRLRPSTQTAYAVALRFGLLEPAEHPAAAARLAETVEADGYRIATGFVGTPLVCDALSDDGHATAAYRLLLQTECPSWLYPVTMGATTIWERWDSMLPDGSINEGEMTSFNHYALGAVADWMHRSVAGLAPAEPGYRKLLVRPLPGGGLHWAEARHETPYGEAAVRWDLAGQEFSLAVTVPAGCTAEVYLPDGVSTGVEVGSGTHSFSCAVPEAATAGSREPVFQP